jgi:glycine dehydrogenase subunit 1
MRFHPPTFKLIEMPFIPNTDKDREEMLKAIGVSSFEELLKPIPKNLRLKKPLDLPPALSEFEIKKLMCEIAKENITTKDYISFLGAGSYDHHIPAVVDYVVSRPEFYTAYTPYQAEVSQGTLQALYEYQSMICELTRMEVANASMYDGATSLAEACLMAMSINERNKVILSEAIHPYYKRVVETYLGKERVSYAPIKNGVTDISALEGVLDDKISAFAVQQPNFLGLLEDVDEIEKIVHKNGGLYIATVLPISLGILKPPGEYNADIAVGEGQSLGLPQSFGGPYLGIFATKRDFIRRMPGRLIGRTTDVESKQGFVMTLQTREQHIRRERATSNICTNESLCAIAAAAYLAIMGKEGMREVGELCLSKAHYLSDKIKNINGFDFKWQKIC